MRQNQRGQKKSSIVGVKGFLDTGNEGGDEEDDGEQQEVDDLLQEVKHLLQLTHLGPMNRTLTGRLWV